MFYDTCSGAGLRWRKGYLCFSASLILSTRELIYLMILVFSTGEKFLVFLSSKASSALACFRSFSNLSSSSV